MPHDPVMRDVPRAPGGATVVASRRRPHDASRPRRRPAAEVTVLAAGRARGPRRARARADAPATVLRALLGAPRRRAARHTSLARAGSTRRALATAVRPGLAARRGSRRSAPSARRRGRRRARRAGSSTARRRRPTCSSRCGARTPRTYEHSELPAPLAEPRLDFRVDRATALAYEVQARGSTSR